MMPAGGRQSAENTFAKHTARLKSACSGQAWLSGSADGPGASCWPLGRQASRQQELRAAARPRAAPETGRAPAGPQPSWADLEAGVAQLGKNLPAIWETWV